MKRDTFYIQNEIVGSAQVEILCINTLLLAKREFFFSGEERKLVRTKITASELQEWGERDEFPFRSMLTN